MKKQCLLAVGAALAIIPLQNMHAQSWSLNGNAGTNATTNFLGTTDSKPLIIRTNNVERLRIANNGLIGIGIKSGMIASLDLRNSTQTNSIYVTNSSTGINQYAFRASVNGANASAFRTGGEFSVTGAGTNNTGLNASATSANVNYGGNFTATGGANSNIGVWGYAGGPSSSTSYAVYGSIASANVGNAYAGYFAGKAYIKNTLTLGSTEVAPVSSSVYLNSPASDVTSIYFINNNNSGNGLWASYSGAPTYYYAVYGAAPTTDLNQAGYFQENVTVTGTFSNPSDERLKENIQPLDNVMDKLMQVGVNSYNFKKEFARMNMSGVKQFGFLAQNLQKQFPELVQTAVDKTKGEGNFFQYKTVNYLGMIPILTKALQEEHTQRLKTEEELQLLKERLIAIETALAQASIAAPSLKVLQTSAAKLEQNAPNPANQKTTINCFIPAASKNAWVVVYASNGTTVKTFSNLAAGANRLEITTNVLAAGIYTYALLVDGKQADSKKMIITKQ